jgi:hypothetical protein
MPPKSVCNLGTVNFLASFRFLVYFIFLLLVFNRFLEINILNVMMNSDGQDS